MSFIMVGLGGLLGAIARYMASLFLFSSVGFPWATLFVNVVGCAAIAVFANMKESLSLSMYLFLVPGFLGAFTTFSAFGLETIQLLQNNQTHLALLNIALNLVLGLSVILIISRLYLPAGGSL